jgi:polar amino acid transport system substrate-binding protein
MPRLEGDGVIVQTICSAFGEGSELGGLRQIRRERAKGQQTSEVPLVERPMSYQSCGRVVEVSENLRESYAVGDLVACSGGGFAAHSEYGYSPKNTIAKVPDGVTPEEAALTNVALTGLHALRRAKFQAGELIGVVGLGMVGQFTLQLAAASGGRAIGSDLYSLRLEKALACGAEAIVDGRSGEFVDEIRRRTGGLGADYIALCTVSGGRELIQTAVRALRRSGVLLLVGGVDADFSGAPDDANPHLKEIDVRWVYGRGPGCREDDWNRLGIDYPSRFVRWTAKTNLEALLQLQARGSVRAAPLITHRFPVERAGEAADLLIEHPDQALGVVLTYGAA